MKCNQGREPSFCSTDGLFGEREREMVSYMSLLSYGIGGIVVAGMALLVAFQEKLVYVPVLPGLTKSYPITPGRLRLLSRTSGSLPPTASASTPGSSSSLRLHRSCIEKCPTILFFQENAGNIAHRLEMVRIMLQKLHCNVFMLSYRGYGASDGYPSQQGITRDAQAALDHLSQRTDIDTSQIIVFGRSLGGAVGAVVTRNNPDKVAALILENTFTSILDMAGVLLPFLKWFIGGSTSKGPKILNFVVRSPWSTIDVVGQIKQPILFLSGLRDEMVPPFHMEMLYAKAAAHNKKCIFVDFPTGMHMDTWLAGGDHYWKTVGTFLQQNVLEKGMNLTTIKMILNPVIVQDKDEWYFSSFLMTNAVTKCRL
ncbi:putative peptidase S9, prolyl oligopeptidase, catalytic domain, alpha/Beta hydrolase [Helianthus annuus]|nr:putative peptidase S9, prolyl oligopeptidase, catalytic domain, alpha/Beta hydrolase [Helianthus annuus]